MTTKTQQENERIELAQQIVNWLGGLRSLRAMIGISGIVILEDGVQFFFKGSKTANKLVVKYDQGQDLFDFQLWQITKKRMVKRVEHKGVFADMLKELFESETGLYTTLV